MEGQVCVVADNDGFQIFVLEPTDEEALSGEKQCHHHHYAYVYSLLYIYVITRPTNDSKTSFPPTYTLIFIDKI